MQRPTFQERQITLLVVLPEASFWEVSGLAEAGRVRT